MGRYILIAAALIACTASPGLARPQARQPPVAAPDTPGITPGEVQRMFDAWVLVQAQDALSLTDAQYGPFAAKLKALQDARRRHQQTRNQILADIRRNLNQGGADEPRLRDRLKALRDEDENASVELRRALDGVDDVLTVPQQARFRVFEERMEARKLELLLKARQNARQGRGKS